MNGQDARSHGRLVQPTGLLTGLAVVAGSLALGSAAAIGVVFLLRNFGALAELEAGFLRELLSYFESPSKPVMAAHPVVIVIVIIACVISAITIEIQVNKLVTYINVTYVKVTRPVLASVWGCIKWVFTTLVYVLVTVVQAVVVVLMAIVIMVNIVAVVVVIMGV